MRSRGTPMTAERVWQKCVARTLADETIIPEVIAAIAINHGSMRCVKVYVSIERLVSAAEGAPLALARERSEAELVERARAGDHDAFAELLDARLSPTFRTAMAILGDEAEARDATQAVFVQAWTRLPQSARRDAVLRVVRPDRGQHGAIGAPRPPPAYRPARSTPAPCRSTMAASPRVAGDTRTAQRTWTASSRHSSGWRRTSVPSCGSITTRTCPWPRSAADGVPARTVKSRLFTARRALERALQLEDR